MSLRYRVAVRLLRPRLLNEYWRCTGALNATPEDTPQAKRQGGYWQGRSGLARDLLERRSVPWMRGPNQADQGVLCPKGHTLIPDGRACKCGWKLLREPYA